MRTILFFVAVLCWGTVSANDGLLKKKVTRENSKGPIKFQNESDSDKPAIELYAVIKQEFANGKHKTLKVEKFKLAHGEKKRLEGDGLGDLFVDIVPYVISSDAESPKNEPALQVTEVKGKRRFRIVMRLSNAPSIDIAEALNKYFENEVTEGDNLAPVINSEVVSNSLVIVSDSEVQLKQIKTMAEALDVRPAMIKAKMLIGETGEGEKPKYLSRPHIMTLENQPGKVSIGAQHPGGGTFGYSVELTMRTAQN